MLLATLLIIMSTEVPSVQAGRNRRKRRDKERDITAEEVIEIAEDSTIVDNEEDELEKKAILEEWETHMKDFVPEDMLTVELKTSEEIVSALPLTLL